MAELNLYRRFVALFPVTASHYGQVVSSTAETVSVQLHQGGLMTVPSSETWATDSWVWIRFERGAWNVSAAPALPTVTVEV